MIVTSTVVPLKVCVLPMTFFATAKQLKSEKKGNKIRSKSQPKYEPIDGLITERIGLVDCYQCGNEFNCFLSKR